MIHVLGGRLWVVVDSRYRAILGAKMRNSGYVHTALFSSLSVFVDRNVMKSVFVDPKFIYHVFDDSFLKRLHLSF